MTADIESLVLEQLRAIRADIAELKHEAASTNVQLAALGTHTMHKKTLMVAGVMLMYATISNANAFAFDPDGAGNINAIPSVTNFNWAPTSYLAVDGVTAANNFMTDPTCQTVSCKFNVLSQATMSSIYNGTTDVTPAGFFAAHEITMIMGFTETITAVGSGTANFTVDTSSPVFLQWWYDATPDAVALTGFGFADGRLILSASSLGAATGNITVGSVPVALDALLTDDYPGQLTFSSTGTLGTLTFGSTARDPSFFPAGPITMAYATGTVVTPYISIDPSDCFHQTASGLTPGNIQMTDPLCDNVHVSGPFSVQPTLGGYVPNTGPVNGQSGPDFDPQIQFTTTVLTIPEPSILGLISIGLAAFVTLLPRGRGKT